MACFPEDVNGRVCTFEARDREQNEPRAVQLDGRRALHVQSRARKLWVCGRVVHVDEYGKAGHHRAPTGFVLFNKIKVSYDPEVLFENADVEKVKHQQRCPSRR